ncbi:MAG: branched-chain amino acid ABC transporter permease [bacterium]
MNLHEATQPAGVRKPARALTAATLVFLLSMPVLLPPLYRTIVLSALVLAIAALGLNVLHRTGVVSFGHATFFALGAYTGGFIYNLTPGGDALEIYLVSGILAVVAVAALFGFACVRARRTFAAILTLALAQIVHALFVGGAIFRLFGGEGKGLYVMYNGGLYIPRLRMFGQALPWPLFDTIFGYVIIAAFVGGVAALWRLDCSPFGWTLRAIGHNEDRAASIGIPVQFYRWLAFVISGAFVGLSGSLWGQLYQQIAPEHLHWMLSAQFVLMNVLGGTQVFWGPALGAMLFVALQEVALRVTLYRGAVLGTLLVILVLFLPGGLMGRLTPFAGLTPRQKTNR